MYKKRINNIYFTEIIHTASKEYILKNPPVFVESTVVFIICHHIKDKSAIREIVSRISGFEGQIFDLFGQHCDIWKKIIFSEKGAQNPKIRASTIDLDGLAERLALFVKRHKDEPVQVIFDDYIFAEILQENFFSDMEFCSHYPLELFRDGFEFVYNGRDCILSIDVNTRIGYLGYEKEFKTKEWALSKPVFDNESFYEIWDKIKHQQKKYIRKTKGNNAKL